MNIMLDGGRINTQKEREKRDVRKHSSEANIYTMLLCDRLWDDTSTSLIPVIIIETLYGGSTLSSHWVDEKTESLRGLEDTVTHVTELKYQLRLVTKPAALNHHRKLT